MKSYCLRLRYAALRAFSDSRLVLADVDAIQEENIRHLHLTNFSPALLMAIHPVGQEEDEPHVNYWRDDAYLRLILALTSNAEWCERLVGDRHIGHCISMLNGLDEHSPAPFQIAAILGRVHSISPNAAGAAFEHTEQKGIPAADLGDVRRNVGLVMEKLKRRNRCLSSMQDYHVNLTGLTET
ncbi:hypothetical protein DEU56DRAFT_822840 [Suillus clintonianus]|uniref:uncharacterized protein n=1 Tax=Suillus clintonianus TaxID=1904413 RepID=UPI001B87BB5D|nr:uncharacterized protein DEU56DRAFT_822840 [Suillus clintonianus]KAG2126202.1 hypothetical protein DEU56DRAFT_822840 [Suillus clintonianus]